MKIRKQNLTGESNGKFEYNNFLQNCTSGTNNYCYSVKNIIPITANTSESSILNCSYIKF